MPVEPKDKRLLAFVDGQALYRSAKDAFGHHFPNYDVQKLTENLARTHGWNVVKIYFYTGVPESRENKFWHDFWAAKLAVMGTRGIRTFHRSIRYQNESIKLKDGSTQIIRVGHEKGIDVRIALDVVRLALDQAYDVGLIFRQDQDLSEVVDEVKVISQRQRRWIKIASAYPISSSLSNKRGINGAEWIKIDKALYDACIDPIDYRPKDIFNPLLP